MRVPGRSCDAVGVAKPSTLRGFRLCRITRHPAEAVTLLAIDLGLRERARH
jgi:hypothetical protein